MGTDIHVFMERELRGSWVPIQPPEVKDPEDWDDFGRYVDPIPPLEQLAQAVLPFEDQVPSTAQEWWVSRDYMLFSNLASVRKYDDYAVFDEPRSLPENVSYAVESAIEDYHSKSYWSLSELQMAKDEASNGAAVSERVDMLLNAMQEIATAYNLAPDQVRMVFGFDS